MTYVPWFTKASDLLWMGGAILAAHVLLGALLLTCLSNVWSLVFWVFFALVHVAWFGLLYGSGFMPQLLYKFINQLFNVKD
jgi:hypothetical protein